MVASLKSHRQDLNLPTAEASKVQIQYKLSATASAPYLLAALLPTTTVMDSPSDTMSPTLDTFF